MTLRYPLCIFDLDGTIADTVPAIRKTANLVLAEYELPPVTPQQVQRAAGDGALKLIERLMTAQGGAAAAARSSEALERYLKLFELYSSDGVEPYPGMREVLTILSERGVKLAVLTNKPQPRAEDNIFGWFGRELFAMVVGARDGLPLKPAPDGARLIAKELQVSPSDCLYIGDTPTDMKTGAGAGMNLCAAAYGFREREELTPFSPKHIIDCPMELADIVTA